MSVQRSSSELHIFEHFHPDRLVKCGIAEQNMMLSMTGFQRVRKVLAPLFED